MITDPDELLRAHFELTNTIAGLRDELRPIAEGVITRGHASPGEKYSATVVGVGKRKTTLKDAKRIAAHLIDVVDRALNKFDAAVYPSPFDRTPDLAGCGVRRFLASGTSILYTEKC